MPLTADNVVQENWGNVTASGTAFTVPLTGGNNPGGVATTEGNTVVVILNAQLGATGTGFGMDKQVSSGVTTTVLRRSEVPAGETSWAFTAGGGTDLPFSYYVAELSNIDPVEPLDASITGSGTVATGGTLSTGTTPLNAGLHTVVFAAFGTSAGSWADYTNGFEEVAETTPSVPLAVTRKFVTGTTGTFQSTGTLTHSAGGSINAVALIVAYRAADSPIVAPLSMIAGFEPGTHGGINSHTGATSMLGSAFAPTGTWGTSYLIQAGSARTSSYGLRVVQAGAAADVVVGNGSVQAGSLGMNVRVVSATGTVIVAWLMSSVGSQGAQILYDASATKFGVRAGATGTVSWESGTTPLNTWRWIDLRVRTNVATYRVEWRIETGVDTYTDQAAAELTGQTPANRLGSLLLGHNAAQTMTVDFDDVCLSNYWVAYPLGPHEVRLLAVDPAGAPTVSGTAANFSVFTANTTLAAWNATNARNAVDEVPPTISAAADGVCQTVTAATDYVEFPMATYTLAADETCVGVRMLCPEWGGTGAGTGTIGYRGYDGTTETTLIAASASYDPDSLTAISATHPRWACAMWQSINGWTQAELDAAALRVGFSTDAAPDMGIHAAYLEIAVGKTRGQQLFGDLAWQEEDPNRGGLVSITVNAPVGVDTDLYYEESGSPTTVPVTGGTSATEQINATFAEDTNYVAIATAAEPAPTD